MERPHRGALILLAVAACSHPAGYIAGDSMIPTNAIGENVALTGPEPVRGRIVVFRYPQKQYIKRIVGVAGDTIASDGTSITVNGTPIRRCDVGAWGYDAHRGEIWLEALDGATTWLVWHETGRPAAPAGPSSPGRPDHPLAGSWTVAPGHVFVVGDNRESSTDSRTFGGLAVDQIIGTATRAPRLPAGAEALAGALTSCIATLATRDHGL